MSDRPEAKPAIGGQGIVTVVPVDLKVQGSLTIKRACENCENTGCSRCDHTGWVIRPMEANDGA